MSNAELAATLLLQLNSQVLFSYVWERANEPAIDPSLAVDRLS